jgi:hypothetical protein
MDVNAASRNNGPAPEGYVKCTQIAKFLNEALKAAGNDKRMRPQMVYGYAKNGRGGLKTDQYPFVPEAAAQQFIDYHFARLTLGDEESLEDNETVDETVKENEETETVEETVEA